MESDRKPFTALQSTQLKGRTSPSAIALDARAVIFFTVRISAPGPGGLQVPRRSITIRSPSTPEGRFFAVHQSMRRPARCTSDASSVFISLSTAGGLPPSDFKYNSTSPPLVICEPPAVALTARRKIRTDSRAYMAQVTNIIHDQLLPC
jgi:hypothetical protein